MIEKIDDLWFKYDNEVMHKSIFVSNEDIFKKLLIEFVENYIDENNLIIIDDLESELSAIEDELIDRNEIISDLEKDLEKKDEIINELEYKIDNLESTIDELNGEIVVLEHDLQTLSDELYNN